MPTPELTCIICGEPSNGYHFCKKCWKKHNEGTVTLKISNCTESEIIENTEITCLICGKPSGDHHFCYDCFQEVRKGADIRLKLGATEGKVIDKYGNREYRADNGVWVRSQGEQSVLNWLYSKSIRAEYEKTVPYGDQDLKPDFYLPDYDLYIEYNGREDSEYLRRKEETLEIYRKEGLNVVKLTPEDIKDPNRLILRKIKPFERKK